MTLLSAMSQSLCLGSYQEFSFSELGWFYRLSKMLRQALTGMQCARHRLFMHCLSLGWGLADGDIGKIASGPCKVNTFSSLVLNTSFWGWEVGATSGTYRRENLETEHTVLLNSHSCASQSALWMTDLEPVTQQVVCVSQEMNCKCISALQIGKWKRTQIL